MSTTLTSHSENKSAGFSGRYYDGRSSRAHSVTVQFNGNTISVTGPDIRRIYRASDVEMSEPLSNAHRTLSFNDGSSCELPDNTRLKSLLARSGRKESFAVRLQHRWRTVALSFGLLIILLALAYRFVLPLAAEAVSNAISDNMLNIISSQALNSLDKQLLRPSTLSQERQDALRKRMSEIKFAPGTHVKPKVEFRNGLFAGPNAFALPDGTIVFFDSLVKLADNDDQLAAVYSHEAGHAHHRHGVRMIVQSSVVALALAAYFGDVSSAAGALTGWLLDAKYSRDFERQADQFAAETLTRNNLSPSLLGDFLLKLEKEHMRQQAGENKSKIFDYISTHPSTEERAREMKKFMDQQNAVPTGR